MWIPSKKSTHLLILYKQSSKKEIARFLKSQLNETLPKQLFLREN